jgi:cobaltochelatase CobS
MAMPEIDTSGKVKLGSIVGNSWDVMVSQPFDISSWDESIRPYIPAKNPNYVYSDAYRRFAVAMELGLKTMLVGMPGTGKDETAKQWCADFNMPYFRIMGMRNVTPDVVVGKYTIIDGTMSWLSGDADPPCRFGGMLVISEPAGMPPDSLFCLQSALESPGYLAIMDHPDQAERRLYLDPKTRVVMTSNVRGFGDDIDKYSATNVMDASTLNRIESMQYVPPMPATQEVEALSRYVPGIDISIMQKMVQFGNLIRAGWNKNEIEPSWSMRNLIAWGKMLAMHGSVAMGFKDTFYDKMSDKEKETVGKLWRDVGFKEAL